MFSFYFWFIQIENKNVLYVFCLFCFLLCLLFLFATFYLALKRFQAMLLSNRNEKRTSVVKSYLHVIIDNIFLMCLLHDFINFYCLYVYLRRAVPSTLLTLARYRNSYVRVSSVHYLCLSRRFFRELQHKRSGYQVC